MNGLKPNPIDELFPVLLSNVKSSIASCFSCPFHQLFPDFAVHFINCLLILLSISSIASCFSWRNKILFKFNGFSQILFNHLAKAQLFFNLQMNGLKPNSIDQLPPALAGGKILFKFNGFSQILFNHLAKAQFN